MDPTTENPVEINERDPKKGVDAARKMLTDAGITDHCDENVFIAATCKDKGIDFLLGKTEINGVRKGALTATAEKATPGGDGTYTVTVSGKDYAVSVKGDTATVNGQAYDFAVADGATTTASSGVPHASADSIDVAAPMNAKVVKINIAVGDHVMAGDILFIVEAMKMEVEVKAPSDATVSSIVVDSGAQVTAGQLMATLN